MLKSSDVQTNFILKIKIVNVMTYSLIKISARGQVTYVAGSSIPWCIDYFNSINIELYNISVPNIEI